MPNEYYDFAHEGWRFVVIDNNDISLYANEPGSKDYAQAEELLAELKAAGAPNAQTWNGALGRRQLAWLKATLADARARGQRALVFGHMPVHGSHSENAWDDKQIIATLESAGNVAAYFSGHNHAGGYGYQDGIHFVNLHGMVEQPAPTTAYSVVTVTRNAVHVDGYGSEPDRALRIGR